MALTMNQWATSGISTGTVEIVDTINNIINEPLFDVPIAGPLLRAVLTTLLGNGSTITALVDGTVGLAGVTAQQITDLADMGTTLLDPVTNSVVPLATGLLMADNGIGFVDDVVMTVTGTAGQITGLDVSDLQDLAGIGIDVVSAGGGAVSMTLSEVNALLGLDMILDELDVGTLVGTVAEIATLTVQGILDLLDLGIDIIDITDGPLYVTVAQAKAFAQANIKFAAEDVVIILDASINIQGMSVADISAVATVGIDAVNAIDNQLGLTIAQITALGTSAISLESGDIVTLLDTAANIAALTTTRIASLGAQGVDVIDATDNVLALSLAQVNAIANASIDLAADDVVTLRDTVATLDALTTMQLQSIGALGVDKLDAIGDVMTITAARAMAIIDNGLSFVSDDAVTLADTGAAIAAMTAADFAALKAAGIDTIDATDDAISLTLAQAMPFAAGGVAFAESDLVTVTGSAAALGLLVVDELTDLAAAGIDVLDATENAVILTVAAAKTLGTVGMSYAADDMVSVVGLGAELADLTAEGMAQLAAAGVDVLDASDDTVVLTATAAKSFVEGKMVFDDSDLVTIADTGANITLLTAENLTGLAAAGVDVIDIVDNELSLSISQFDSFITAGFTFASDDVVTLADTGSKIAALTVTQIANLATAGVDKLDSSTNAVTLTMDQLTAFRTAGIAFTAADTVALAATSASVLGFTDAQLTEFTSWGIDAFDLTDNAITLTSERWTALGDFGFGLNDVITVKGGGGKDQLTARGDGTVILQGFNGRDVLHAGADTTILSGGKGKDKLFGDDGSDQFLFSTKASARNVDKVYDFDRAEDTIVLDNNVFKAIGVSFTKNEFALGRHALDSSDHLIYDKAHGTLYYDQDGAGGHAAVKIAVFEHGLKLGLADFDIV